MMTQFLTHFEANKMLREQTSPGTTAEISLDLGLTSTWVEITDAGIELDHHMLINWEDLEVIRDNPNNVFYSNDGKWTRVKAYSSEFNRVYSLYPTLEAPTMLISGIPMHRIKDITPWQDTQRKIKALGSAHGAVLDTSTGLGYTAIWAAKTASSVDTIELDPVVLEICQLNPWSRRLFTSENITQHVGHSWDVMEGMEAGIYSRVIHDPPALSLAGDLYSLEYYLELHRVMKYGSILFHYIGDPKSKSGHRTMTGVIQRLEKSGFTAVQKRPEAFGVVARKGN